MSLFRLPKLRKRASSKESTRTQRQRNKLAKPRRLMIDPLEERALLTVAPAGWEEMLVVENPAIINYGTQTYTDPIDPSHATYSMYRAVCGQPVLAPHRSMAADHSGNFVVTWTRTDVLERLVVDDNTGAVVKDAFGKPIYQSGRDPMTGEGFYDPATGLPYKDSNVYARYFTDEVQRVTLPDAVLTNSDGNADTRARFDMTFGGTWKQTLTFSAASPPFGASSPLIVGRITLVNDGGSALTTGPIFYNEADFQHSDPTLRPDQVLQRAIRNLGSAYSNVTVKAIDSHTFTIDYGEGFKAGPTTPLLQVDTNPANTSFNSGFLAGALLKVTNQPITVKNIPIDPANPLTTAIYIRDALAAKAKWDIVPPWQVQGPDDYSRRASSAIPGVSAPDINEQPAAEWKSLTDVLVVPVLGVDGQADGTVFDIQFRGAAGKKDVPLMKIEKVSGDTGTAMTDPSKFGVRTLKEPSGAFRVNIAEPIDVIMDRPRPTQETQAAVAMDSDGEFVIAWTGSVSDLNNAGSISDIFARRFSPQALVVSPSFTDAEGNVIQGVRPLSGQFQVNSTTTNRQQMPAIGVDGDGNFSIAWATVGQTLSYFNYIAYQRYNRDGERVGSEIRVVTNDATDVMLQPAVAMSADGHTAIAWMTTNDPSYFVNATYNVGTSFRIYAPNGTPTSPIISQPGAGADPSLAFDYRNRLLLGWRVGTSDASYGNVTTDCYAAQYDVDGTSLRAAFRINSPTNAGGGRTAWPGFQTGQHVGVDADGDIIATYEGYGPDMSIDVNYYGYNDGQRMIREFLAQYISGTKNSDLLPFFNPSFEQFRTRFYNRVPNIDIHGAMEELFVRARGMGATDQQLGRLNAILMDVLGVLRGEASGIFFSQWDADATGGAAPNVIAGDSIVNSRRDGANTRSLISFTPDANAGNLVLDLNGLGLYNGIGRSVTIPVVYINQVVDVEATRRSIRDTLRGVLGPNWPTSQGNDDDGGSVSVRTISYGRGQSAEVTARKGTYWDLTGEVGYSGTDTVDTVIIYEVTFQGEAHDTLFDLRNQTSATDIRIGNLRVPVYVTTAMSGGEGTHQRDASLAVQPDGSFVVAWSEQTAYAGVDSDFYRSYRWDPTAPAGYYALNYFGPTTNLYVRSFIESTDTAGPRVTDFLNADGTRIANGAQLTSPMQYVVVTLDEDMIRSGEGNVTDPANWVLMRDGVAITGGVKEVYFGMNKASDLASRFGLSALGSNKYEAILVLDGNGQTDGSPALEDGHYTIAALSKLRDRNNNALGKTGTQVDVNGLNFTRSFDIVVPRGVEQRVNVPPHVVGGQVTQDLARQCTASDAKGNYVVVWADTTPASRGVWAQLYTVAYTTDPLNGTRSSTSTPNGSAFRVDVSNFSAASFSEIGYANVAMDPDGDFVVTWAQKSVDAQQGWDVYARRFNAVGTAMDSRKDLATPVTDRFRVNTETKNQQNCPAVAVDSAGDFVVTWQSNNQDGSGYGIYAQRFTPDGFNLGGINESQLIRFYGTSRGRFQLSWNGKTTGWIKYNGSTYATAADVATALNSLVVGDRDARFIVQAVSASDLVVTFAGSMSSSDQAPITIAAKELTGGVGEQLTASVIQDGTSGEFRINDTTNGDQMNPAVAMTSNGDFCVTWTSFGQGTDQAWESNIYAKRYAGNSVLRSSAAASAASGHLFAPADDATGRQWFVLSNDSPDNHVVQASYDGVCQVITNAGVGSGSLLISGNHILTAAHVVADNTGTALAPSQIFVAFNLPTGRITIPVAQVYVNPGYLPQMPGGGGDIAILTLVNPAPTLLTRYDIYRQSDELGQVSNIYGFGVAGTGATGATLPYGTLRQGQNRFEMLGDSFGSRFQWNLSRDQLVFDFDDGTSTHDGFGVNFGLPDPGLGTALEVSIGSGDSGGPSFLKGLIAGVHCAGFFPANNPADINAGVPMTYGEFASDTRVSVYAGWIDRILQGGTPEILVNSNQSGDQKWSSVACDASGNYVVTWTTYGQDNVGTGEGAGSGGLNGIAARRFTSALSAREASEWIVNTTRDRDQQHSQVACDMTGNFVITWESFQRETPLPLDGIDTAVSYGIYLQRYLASGARLGGEIRVNDTIAGDQRFPGVAMDRAGDIIVVWSGNGDRPGQEDTQGVFFKRFDAVKDKIGPSIVDVLNEVRITDAGGNVSIGYQRIGEDAVLAGTVYKFVVTFDEPLFSASTSDSRSITNLNNWQIKKGSTAIPGGIVAPITYGFNALTGKWEAAILFDSSVTDAGNQPLGAGSYTLTIRDSVQDLDGNALDGNLDGVPGSDFQRRFTIRTTGTSTTPTDPGTPGPNEKDTPVVPNTLNSQDGVVVATDVDGNYVIAWVVYGQGSDAGTTNGNIMVQRFNKNGQAQGSAVVANTVPLEGMQNQVDVAMDPFGGYVVVWTGPGELNKDATDIYARRFNAMGQPVDVNGSDSGENSRVQFRVNQSALGAQSDPAVAIDPTGAFVVTWNDYSGTSGDGSCVMARKFRPDGTATNDILVNTFGPGAQSNSDVAMDAFGNFVVVWQSENQDKNPGGAGSGLGVFGRWFSTDGVNSGAEFQVNSYATNDQNDPQIAMDANGNFVVVWSSFVEDGSGYGVYARRYQAQGGGAHNALAPFRVNQVTSQWQYMPAVAMDSSGNIAFTWTAYGQGNTDPNNCDVFSRLYNADGSDRLSNATGLPIGEFRVNAELKGNQYGSKIALSDSGSIIAVWCGPLSVTNGTTTTTAPGIFQRRIGAPVEESVGTSYTLSAEVLSGEKGWSGGWTLASVAAPKTNLVGTAGNDVFEFVINGASPANWIVRVNGVAQRIVPGSIDLAFDGLGGNDTVLVTGSAHREIVDFYADRATVAGNGFTFTASNVENVSFQGDDLLDQAVFHDSTGDDVFTGGPNGFVMTGPNGSFRHTAARVKTVTAVASQGNDTASFEGTAGNDLFTATPTTTTLVSADGTDNFLWKTQGFKRVSVRSTQGDDTACFLDSDASVASGNDVFVGSAASSTMSGAGYANTAEGFDYVIAKSTGGTDSARLSDSAGNDAFTAKPNFATLTSAGYRIQLEGFGSVAATSGAGGTDVATFTGSAGDDVFRASPDSAVLSGPGYVFQADRFRNVTATAGTSGNDTAYLAGSPTLVDTVVASSAAVSLKSSDYLMRASGFDAYDVTSSGSAADVARVYDSAGDDVFEGRADSAVMRRAGVYTMTFNGFANVTAFSTAGGNDTAKLYDSTGADTFTAKPTEASMSGPKAGGSGSYYLGAINFRSVEAVATGSNTAQLDTARFIDSAGDDAFLAGAAYAQMIGVGFNNKASGFASYSATASQGRDTATLDATDGNDNISVVATSRVVRVNAPSATSVGLSATGFKELTVNAKGGDDAVKFYDSALDDILDGAADWAKLSNLNLDFAATVRGLGAYDRVEMQTSNDTDVIKADKTTKAYDLVITKMY